MDYLKTKGRIFNIQRYSIHDGTGIRTIIFLKGCVLRCKWCCNPESQQYDIQTRKVNGKEMIEGKDVTVQEVLDIVERDVPYYKRSNGGLTLSGGECLFQPEFARDLLRGAKEMGINTAIETTSCANWEIIKDILPYVDQYLMDIKHIDNDKHLEFIGRDNQLMLENARKIADSNLTNLVIRVPIVPTFNNQPDEIRRIAQFVDSLHKVTQIHLLPYHRLGQDKYEQLNRSYQLLDIMPPEMEEMLELKNIVEMSTKLECQIGG